MSMKSFICKHFVINQDMCPMKAGTDALVLGARADTGRASKILDIGTGTGIIALMLAQRTLADIDAVEIDDAAARQAKENFMQSVWKNRLHLYHASAETFSPGKTYDLVISNPPFFELNLREHRQSEKYRQRTWARSTASLSFEQLIATAFRLLNSGGSFWVIIPAVSKKGFIQAAGQAGFYLATATDIYGKPHKPPVRAILSFVKNPAKPEYDTLLIYDADGNYSDGYISLTRDFHAIDLAARKQKNQAEQRNTAISSTKK